MQLEPGNELMALAQTIEGFIGIESARSGLGITVSYWKHMDAINNWRENAEHLVAKDRAKQGWYKSFTSTIAKIESSRRFKKD